MKKIIVFLLLLTLLTPSVFAYYPGYEYGPADPVETACDELYTDGRRISNEFVASLSRQMGVRWRKLKTEGDDAWRLTYSRIPYIILTLEEGETPESVQCWGGGATSAPLERLGYNSSYFILMDCETDFGNGRHAFGIALSEEAYTELGLYDLSDLDRLYVELSIYDGMEIYFDSHWDRIIGADQEGTVNLGSAPDLNLDGTVNVKDVVLLKKYVVGSNVRINLIACDCDKDGSVNVKDLKAMKNYLVGETSVSGESVQDAPFVGEVPETAYSASLTAIGSSSKARDYRSHVVSFFGIDSEGKDISSVGGVIDSYASYAQFIEEEAFALPHLEESFFEDNVLVLGYVGSPCCNYEFTTDGVSFDGETLTVALTLHDGGIGLDALEDYVVFVEVAREYAAGASAARIAPASESGHAPLWW